MKVPISWLKEYVEFDASPEEIAEKLTFSGIEVEGIETVGGGREGLVVGEVLNVEPHPSADRLRLCRVSDGTDELPIVCGADNVETGAKVALAGVGVTLPGGIKIKKAKIRGEVSLGMLCAEDELGLSDDHSGIMILPPETKTGTPLSEVIGPPETVLELEVTWNRPDCLCIIGVAREIAALFGSELKIPEISLKESDQPTSEFVNVKIDEPELCSRYTARALSDVKIAPSPTWMQKRLNLCGIRPINNIVDITNYVMLECGHPLHAFDHKLLTNQKIVVRKTQPGEKMSTLDEIERPLTSEMLVIADSERPVALAGVMGGAGSEINDKTETVLLESASFDPASIRSTSSALKLTTESSHRFERWVNPETVEWASNRAAALMQELANAVVAREIVDVYPLPPQKKTIELDYSNMKKLLGMDVSPDETTGILKSLMLPVTRQVDDGCTVEVPAFRRDLEREADLIEEIARMHGLDKLPESIPSAKIVPGADDSETQAQYACRSILVGLGLNESMNYSFLSKQLLDLFCDDDQTSRVILPNPVSADYAEMRNSLVPQMVESLGRNLSRQISEASFFEIGRVFFKKKDGSIAEEDRLCIGLLGPVGRSGMNKREPVKASEMFLWIKGIIESLCAAEHVRVTFGSASSSIFDESADMQVLINGKPAGKMGLVKSRIRKEWRMTEPVGIAEIDLKALLTGAFSSPELKPLPKYPGISRDVALVVDAGVSHADILKIIHKFSPPELTRIELFDIFLSESVGEGQKSLAYSMIYRSLERTLTDEEANKLHETVKKALKTELGAEIREN